mmetsp:Transcript_1130/g.4143  ORF Transcript_1130/g.4143 Transcript_1130/m.4143 type:complete len:242 (-) Transcript_1130:1074-1799(-)
MRLSSSLTFLVDDFTFALPFLVASLPTPNKTLCNLLKFASHLHTAHFTPTTANSMPFLHTEHEANSTTSCLSAASTIFVTRSASATASLRHSNRRSMSLCMTIFRAAPVFQSALLLCQRLSNCSSSLPTKASVVYDKASIHQNSFRPRLFIFLSIIFRDFSKSFAAMDMFPPTRSAKYEIFSVSASLSNFSSLSVLGIRMSLFLSTTCKASAKLCKACNLWKLSRRTPLMFAFASRRKTSR